MWLWPSFCDVLPGADEVLGHTDTGRRARDRDLAHGGAISGTGNFDVSSRDLADLIDLAALSSNYAANKLEGGGEREMWITKEIWFPWFSEVGYKTEILESSQQNIKVSFLIYSEEPALRL